VDGSRQQVDERQDPPSSGLEIRASYRQTVRICLSAGLAAESAEDVAQDIWEWLIRSGRPIEDVTAPWLGSVVRNFVMRYRRRQSVLARREGRRLDRVPEPEAPESAARIESRELLDHVASILPETERNLLTLIRRGHSLAEAARLAGIPRGSRAYFHGRLIEYARRELSGRPEGTRGASLRARRTPL
jgi:DNA-directed RNA polymerase specialized sigma24 family protein